MGTRQATERQEVPLETTDVTGKAQTFLWKLLPFIILLVGWEIIGRVLGSHDLPPFSRVSGRLFLTAADGEALPQVWGTLWKMILSLGIGSILGIGLGIAIPLIRSVESFAQPLIYATYALPRVALIPLFVLWLGLGAATVVAAASFAVFYVIVVNTSSGVQRAVDPTLVRAARNLGARGVRLVEHVILPAAIAPILDSLRLGIGQALISVVSGELLIGKSGLGYWIWQARYRSDTPLVFVNLIWLAVMGLAVTSATGLLSSARTRSWRSTSANRHLRQRSTTSSGTRG